MLMSCRRTLPAYRHIGLTNPAAAASERAEEARTAQAPQFPWINFDRMAAALTRYTRDLVTSGHGTEAYERARQASIQYQVSARTV